MKKADFQHIGKNPGNRIFSYAKGGCNAGKRDIFCKVLRNVGKDITGQILRHILLIICQREVRKDTDQQQGNQTANKFGGGAGVDATQIRTWDDFTAACQSVLDNTDAAPIEMCLGDGYDSYALECIWPTLYSNEDVASNQADALKDGSFDWEANGSEGFQMIADWYNAGFLNEDYVSCQKDDVCQAMANGEGAFSLYSTEMIPSVLAYNESANIGILPVPASSDDGASYFGIGEGNFSCFGIWKDTKYEDECKQLLEYLAQPEIAVQITRIDGGIPALSTIELESTDQAAYTANAYSEAQTQFEGDLCYDNFFDREYLPSGMWSVMADAVATLLADGDPEGSMDAAVTAVADNYNDLMGN